MEKIGNSSALSFFKNLLKSKSRCDFYSKRKRLEIQRIQTAEGSYLFIRISKIRKPPKKFYFVAIDFVPEQEAMIFSNGAGLKTSSKEFRKILRNAKRLISNSVRKETYA